MSGSGPPDKFLAFDFSSYTTLDERVNQLNTIVAEFYSTYGVYPGFVVFDSTVDGVYLGAYGS